MFTVWHPDQMNDTFARAFNSRVLANLLALYEENALLRTGGAAQTYQGRARIAEALQGLLAMPGRMVSRNNFCLEADGLALLRADFALYGDDGAVLLGGGTAEVLRRQPDGSWRYLIDHAAAVGAPSVLG